MASCSSGDDQTTDLTLWSCPLCLESYKCPKLLPCSHTFCKECLTNLLKHQTGGQSTTFPCPSCREMIRVPSGGVAGFKNNYYIEAARTKQNQQLLCKVHPSKPRELELYCHKCEKCICLKCKLDDHADHPTEDIEDMSKAMTGKLNNDLTGLTNTILGLKRQFKIFSAEQEAVRDKKAAVERDILNRHKMMVAMADKCRDEAVFSLDTVTASIESQLDRVTGDMQRSLDELTKLKKRIEKCLKGEQGSGMLVTAQQIYDDAHGLEKGVTQLMTSHIITISRPVLRFSATADATLRMERKFLGNVDAMTMPVSGAEFSVKRLFHCPSPTGSCDVYSLFPRADDAVWIVYEPCFAGDEEGARCPELFSLNGEVIGQENTVKSRTNFTHTNSGTGMCALQTPGTFTTYAKSRKLLKLKNHMNGTATVVEVMVKSENPLKTLTEPRFSLSCGLHRAFDVDENKVLYAVVEEAQPHEPQRKVLLYHRVQSEKPIAMYQPPIHPFQPSDVCFYKIGGRRVLLVSDELNDAIHVVHLSDSGAVEFGGYLAPGCVLITQPTALNTDFEGRLWLACRGGDILVCQPH